MGNKPQRDKDNNTNKRKRPLSKSDLEAVLKSATKPLKKEAEKESEGT